MLLCLLLSIYAKLISESLNSGLTHRYNLTGTRAFFMKSGDTDEPCNIQYNGTEKAETLKPYSPAIFSTSEINVSGNSTVTFWQIANSLCGNNNFFINAYNPIKVSISDSRFCIFSPLNFSQGTLTISSSNFGSGENFILILANGATITPSQSTEYIINESFVIAGRSVFALTGTFSMSFYSVGVKPSDKCEAIAAYKQYGPNGVENVSLSSYPTTFCIELKKSSFSLLLGTILTLVSFALLIFLLYLVGVASIFPFFCRQLPRGQDENASFREPLVLGNSQEIEI